MTARRAYRLDEVAEMIGVGVKTLRREVSDGALRARRIRGAVVVLASELDRYLAAAAETPSAQQPTNIRSIRQHPRTPRERVTRLWDVTAP